MNVVVHTTSEVLARVLNAASLGASYVAMQGNEPKFQLVVDASTDVLGGIEDLDARQGVIDLLGAI